MAEPVRLLEGQPVPEGFSVYNLPAGGGRWAISNQTPTEERVAALLKLVPPDLATQPEIKPPSAGQMAVDAVRGASNAMAPVTTPITEAYKDAIAPVTTAVAYPAGVIREGLEAGYNRLTTGQWPPGGQTPSQFIESGRPIAEAVVPQTPLEAGMMIGGGIGGLATKDLVSGAARMAGRVGGSVLGAEVGNQFQGGTTGKGLLTGAVGGGAGELAGKGYELARRGITNLTGGLYAQDAKKLGAAIGDLVPTLGTPKDAKELRDLVMTGDGKKKLFGALTAAYDDVKAALPNPNAVLHVPTLDPEGLGYLPFDSARKRLTDLFNKGFLIGQETASPGKIPGQAAREAKEAFFQAIGEIRSSLNTLDKTGAAVKSFDEGRAEFRKGINILDLLYKANGPSNRLFSPSASGVSFNTQRLQTVMSGREEKLRQKLGPANYEEIARVVFRGAEPGMGDTAGISLGNMLTTTQLPVSGGAFRESFPKISIPNYAGQPFKPSPDAQTLIDLMAQQGVGRATE